MAVGVLVDLTRCMGCRACQVACKAWNDNPGEVTLCLGCYDNPPDFSADTWSLIQFDEVEAGNQLHWIFTKRQCMHCEHPACVSVCPVQALHKLDQGPVVYDADRCIGCRYCMVACPFHVPRIDWYKVLPEITKCNFCADRQAEGMAPACCKSCPTGALTFGDRSQLISEADARIRKFPGKYVNYIYGKDEAGGTSWMYLSAVPFETLRLPKVDLKPVAEVSEQVAVYGTPTALAVVAAALGGVYWISKRREKNMAKSGAEGEEEA